MILDLRKTTWTQDINHLVKYLSSSMSQWLTQPYILGDALEKTHGKIEVELLSQQFDEAFENELTFLKESSFEQEGFPFFVREVYLKNKEKCLSYGRVLIPSTTFLNNEKNIVELKNQSFGKKILYVHPDYKRSPFEYALIKHDVFSCGRRSIFWLGADPLIVTEFYIHDLGVYPQ